MYSRLDVTNHWLEWSGLTQRSNLELMRQRLAGDMPHQPLDRFASILEPVKGYARHAENYTSFTPLNHLVDSIPPESNAAREFRDAVDKYLALPKAQRNSAELRKQLTAWDENAAAVRPVLQRNSLLNEDLPVQDAVAKLCQAGEQALSYLDAGATSTASADWKQRNVSTIQDAVQRKGDILIQMAPAIQKLVDAVPTPTE